MKIRSNNKKHTFLSIKCCNKDTSILLYNKSIDDFIYLLKDKLFIFDEFYIITVNGWVFLGDYNETNKKIKMIKNIKSKL
jgi:hypothetical protein